MVNHDLTGTFCVWLNLAFNDRVLILEIGAIGVALADIFHYRDRSDWEEKKEGPAPEPLRLDYADPQLMQQIEAGIEGYFRCQDQQ
jgi:hypothetical protein